MASCPTTRPRSRRRASFGSASRAPSFYEGLHPEIEAATRSALSVLGDAGRPRARRHARDRRRGCRASCFAPRPTPITSPCVASTPELYQPETLKRIRGGAEVTAAAYIAAKAELETLRRGAQAVFERVDLLVTPTVPVPPPTLDELLADMANLRAREMLLLRNTRPFNVLGLPTISVPCGFTSDGLPIGLQITGAAGDEARVLALAHRYEQATDWHTRRPSL